MSDFSFFFSWGWHHIISWDALDHILFILVLSAIYLLRNWRQLLVLVTAFTIGHSLTLALSVYNLVHIQQSLVEVLIPCTIMATALFNFFQKNYEPRSLRLNYFLALIFGLIHGMGFASALNEIGLPRNQFYTSILSFNIGVELGQVAVILAVFALLIVPFGKKTWYRQRIVYPLSAVIALIAAWWTIERVFFQ